jgi:hypothetical protein
LERWASQPVRVAWPSEIAASGQFVSPFGNVDCLGKSTVYFVKGIEKAWDLVVSGGLVEKRKKGEG